VLISLLETQDGWRLRTCEAIARDGVAAFEGAKDATAMQTRPTDRCMSTPKMQR
jgi:hypothetical protein